MTVSIDIVIIYSINHEKYVTTYIVLYLPFILCTFKSFYLSSDYIVYNLSLSL